MWNLVPCSSTATLQTSALGVAVLCHRSFYRSILLYRNRKYAFLIVPNLHEKHFGINCSNMSIYISKHAVSILFNLKLYIYIYIYIYIYVTDIHKARKPHALSMIINVCSWQQQLFLHCYKSAGEFEVIGSFNCCRFIHHPTGVCSL
jgi:hypothetical protein